MATTTPDTITRVAFLTPEYLTEAHGSGGIANYVAKMAATLAVHGVTSEVFVPSREPGVVSFEGIRVHRVPRERSVVARGVSRALRPFGGSRTELLLHLMDARRLARALERRHAELPFDVVQSSNHNLTGFFVRAAPGRRRLIRISTSRRLYDGATGLGDGGLSRLSEALDVRAIRRADVAYAPSRLLADHFNRCYGADVHVLRPPAGLGTVPSPERLPFELPGRYFVHFGSLGQRKGTDVVARALSLAWRQEPDLRMVMIGPISPRALAEYQAAWGSARDRVSMVGQLDKASLYAVVRGALASVLPSKIDNLPNTVIESLVLGVPVIGSDGASIDELVEHGRSGALVPIGDEAALSEAMLEAWQGRAPWLGPGFVAPAVLAQMQPDEAVRRFLDLATGAGTRSP
ncbi:MAG: glycosyltransferase family 4 protein [Trueperaceae bacterium]|nr:glycosyltransferase family 4 protein [Trueperaceae bacterium]